jgi:hypothetical protein
MPRRGKKFLIFKILPLAVFGFVARVGGLKIKNFFPLLGKESGGY